MPAPARSPLRAKASACNCNNCGRRLASACVRAKTSSTAATAWLAAATASGLPAGKSCERSNKAATRWRPNCCCNASSSAAPRVVASRSLATSAKASRVADSIASHWRKAAAMRSRASVCRAGRCLATAYATAACRAAATSTNACCVCSHSRRVCSGYACSSRATGALASWTCSASLELADSNAVARTEDQRIAQRAAASVLGSASSQCRSHRRSAVSNMFCCSNTSTRSARQSVVSRRESPRATSGNRATSSNRVTSKNSVIRGKRAAGGGRHQPARQRANRPLRPHARPGPGEPARKAGRRRTIGNIGSNHPGKRQGPKQRRQKRGDLFILPDGPSGFRAGGPPHGSPKRHGSAGRNRRRGREMVACQPFARVDWRLGEPRGGARSPPAAASSGIPQPSRQDLSQQAARPRIDRARLAPPASHRDVARRSLLSPPNLGYLPC